MLSWASHQLFRSFICFLVDSIDFKTESYLSLINCCDDSIELRRFDRLVIRQFTFSISVFSSFLISFLMLGRNSVFQIFRILSTVSGSEKEAIFLAELRSRVAIACHTPSPSPIQHCKNRTTFFGKTYQFSDHQVDFESVSVAFSYFQRIFAKEKYRLSFMRLNCNSGGNSPRVRYCALAQKVA